MSYVRFLSTVTRISDSDHHSALALVSEAAATRGAAPFEHNTIENLLRMIPADRAGYFEYGGNGDGTSSSFFVDAPPGGCDPSEWDAETVQSTISSWPLRDDAGPNDRPPLKMSDFLTHFRLRRNPWYSEVMRPNGIEHELKFWLAGPEASVRGFFLVRGPRTRDFDERDRALLQLLRPHMTDIRARWERRRRLPLLTPRETEVLEYVALGLTNKEIATRLVVSRTTVRTHLENIFGKLDLHSRAQLAVWAAEHGLAGDR